MISLYTRALAYCFFVVRHVGTSTAQHTRHSTSRLARHVVLVVPWRDVTQQVEFGLFC